MSEPELLSEVLPDVMRDIEARCDRYRKEHGLSSLDEERRSKQTAKNHAERILSATGDFLNKKKQNRRRPRRTVAVKEKQLF